MPEYLRWRIAGGSYFFTVVSASRRPIFTTDLGRRCLREAIEEVRNELPFELFAFVLLPDHFHCIWNLPMGDDDYPTRWANLKAEFTKRFLRAGGTEAPISASRKKKRERGVWQRRYWEHSVRDDDDLKRCLDYLHYNPVKHAYVRRVKDWPWSTFRQFVALGEYHEDWGSDCRYRLRSGHSWSGLE